MSLQVCAILRVRIDLANQWLGQGEMLTSENMFLPPAYDGGYARLLQRYDIFEGEGFSIIKYV